MFVVNLLSYQKESAKVRKNTIKSSVFDRYFGIYFFAFLSVLYGSIVQEN